MILKLFWRNERYISHETHYSWPVTNIYIRNEVDYSSREQKQTVVLNHSFGYVGDEVSKRDYTLRKYNHDSFATSRGKYCTYEDIVSSPLKNTVLV